MKKPKMVRTEQKVSDVLRELADRIDKQGIACLELCEVDGTKATNRLQEVVLMSHRLNRLMEVAKNSPPGTQQAVRTIT